MVIRGKAPNSEGSERSWIELTFKRCNLFEKSIQRCISHRNSRSVINVHQLAATITTTITTTNDTKNSSFGWLEQLSMTRTYLKVGTRVA